MISGTYKQQCNNYCDANFFFYLNDTLEGVTCISTSDVCRYLTTKVVLHFRKYFNPTSITTTILCRLLAKCVFNVSANILIRNTLQML